MQFSQYIKDRKQNYIIHYGSVGNYAIANERISCKLV